MLQQQNRTIYDPDLSENERTQQCSVVVLGREKENGWFKTVWERLGEFRKGMGGGREILKLGKFQ